MILDTLKIALKTLQHINSVEHPVHTTVLPGELELAIELLHQSIESLQAAPKIISPPPPTPREPKPRAWLLECSYEGQEDWRTYDVYRTADHAWNVLLKCTGNGIQGRVIPLIPDHDNTRY
jgi:hypothetical protein